jgi:hypothetical protein
VSRSVTPLLPAAQAAEAWNALTEIGCASKLPAAQASWLALMRAVARRDASAMATLAERLLDPALEHNAPQRQYLVMAAMTGRLAMGEREKAAAVWTRNRKDVEKSTDLTFRLLRAHAFPSPAKPEPPAPWARK